MSDTTLQQHKLKGYVIDTDYIAFYHFVANIYGIYNDDSASRKV